MKKALAPVVFFCLTVAAMNLAGQEKALKVGDKAPDLHLSSVLQSKTAFDAGWRSLRGKIVILEFWATWCGPCRGAIPHLNDLVQKYRNQPVEFLSITDEEEWKVKNFLGVQPISGKIGLDRSRTTFSSYQISFIPKTVIVDKNGNVAAILSPDQLTADLLDALLAGLAAGRPSASQASSLKPEEPKPQRGPSEPEPLVEAIVRPAARSISMSMSLNSFNAKGWDLTKIVAFAYGVSPIRVYPADPRSPEKYYHVSLKIPASQKELLRPTLQKILEAAFRLKVHSETREIEVFVVRVPENGKTLLRKVKAESDMPIMGDDGQVASEATPIRFFSSMLEDMLGRVVIDETRLEGFYNLALYWDPKLPESVISAARNQLGLEFSLEKRPIDVWVYEAVEGPQNK